MYKSVPITIYKKYKRIDMIVNQDKLFTIYVKMIRTIWAQTRQNLADLRVLKEWFDLVKSKMIFCIYIDLKLLSRLVQKIFQIEQKPALNLAKRYAL